MTETAVKTFVETPKRSGTAKPKASKKANQKSGKPKVSSHPPTSQMVDAAIKNLNEKGGSSLQAVKKYIAAQYKVDTSKTNAFIKKYLRNSVASGKLVQTKGTGASGSFKFPSKEKVVKETSTKPKKTTKTPARQASTKPKPVAKKTKVAKSISKPKPKKLKVTTAKPAKAVKKSSPAKKIPKRANK